ncbi:DUF6449 domain-containing protein [Neobacillus sp. D3-1R]|uniref:DUF6449 domain-containing protein n=1 Tax=Neobacillus sp. D3-1R TaxID=3445778 RepID=UPI003F9F45BB
MPLKTLSFNQGILSQNVRNLSWIGIIYFLILLFVIPLQFVLLYNNGRNQYSYYHWENVFALMEPIQVFIMFIIPVLLAVVLFRYLHVKGAADFYHSLPVKREIIYTQNVVFGLFTLTIPVFLIGLILTVFYNNLHVVGSISITEIWNWVGVTLLFNYFVFFTSVFVAMVTGISAVHAILTYVLFVLPVGIFTFCILNLEYFLFGFSSQYYINSNVERFVPFVRAVDLARMPLSGLEALTYSAITILMSVLALAIYKIRRIESAQQAIAFQNLKPFFKYGVAFCCLLVGGFYFGESQDQLQWILFGMFAASLIGFFAAEMVLQKTWRVFKEWKGFVFFITAMALIGVLFHLASAKFEHNLPNVADVNRVYLGESAIFIKRDINQNQYEFNTNPNFFLDEKENIQRVFDIHKSIINGQNRLEGIPSYDTRSVVIGYELNNGKMIVREYNIPDEEYNHYFAEIVETKEYKYNHFPLLGFTNTQDIKKISFHPNGPVSDSVVLTDPEEMNELVEILKDEMLNESASTMVNTNEQESWAYLEIFASPNVHFQVDWKKSYQKVEAWLKEKELLDHARLTSKSISKIIVAKNDQKLTEMEMKGYVDRTAYLEKLENKIVITDPAQMDEILKKANWYENGDYIVGYFFKDNNIEPMLQSFTNENVPDFVKMSLK